MLRAELATASPEAELTALLADGAVRDADLTARLADVSARVDLIAGAVDGVSTAADLDAVRAALADLGNPSVALEREIDALRADLANALDYVRETAITQAPGDGNSLLSAVLDLRTDLATTTAESLSALARLAEAAAPVVDLDAAMAPYVAALEDLRTGQGELTGALAERFSQLTRRPNGRPASRPARSSRPSSQPTTRPGSGSRSCRARRPAAPSSWRR